MLEAIAVNSAGGHDVDASAVRSRRAVLGAGLGALAATVASAIGRPAPARAEGEPVVVGGAYTDATSRTRLRNQTNDADVFVAESAGGGTAIVAIGTNSTGMAGTSTGGIGVYAGSTNNIAAYATSDNGIGIRALGPVGLEAIGTTALVTAGRLRLSSSGLVTIPANAKSITFSQGPGVLTPASFMLVSAATDIGARRLWWTMNVPGDATTIHISSARTKATKVSYLLLDTYQGF